MRTAFGVIINIMAAILFLAMLLIPAAHYVTANLPR